MCPKLQLLKEKKKEQIKRKNDAKWGNTWRKGILEMSKYTGVELNWISITNHFCLAYIFFPDCF